MLHQHDEHYTGLNWRVDLPVTFTLGEQSALLETARHLGQGALEPVLCRWSFRKGVARFAREQEAAAVAKALSVRLTLQMPAN